MTQTTKNLSANELYNYVKAKWPDLSIYIWVDVWKNILDIGATVSDGWIQSYLWTIYNSAIWFKQIEKMIINLILLWVDENRIFFGTENTGIYWHDIMNFFDDRLPNTYLLNSSLTFHARKFYAKSDYKSDDIDSIVIANTMKDLDNKNQLESIRTPFKKNCGLWFVRKSFSKERNSLRLLFRRLSVLRCQKSKLMVSINLSKERLFPEINRIFSIKHRATSEAILLNHFTREDILKMSKDEFIEKYKSIATPWQSNARVIKKVEEFYKRVKSRWMKTAKSDLDSFMWKNSDSYILEEIKFKLKHYELTCKEMKIVQQKIADLLDILRRNGYFIPRFRWINDIELGLIIWELWFDVYKMNAKEFIGFVGWYPENYTSWWWHMVKPSQLSHKKWIIKRFVYVWMYGFQLHNMSFRLYKKLLTLQYAVSEEWHSIISMKTKRKIEIKCWEKLLKIIHNGYRNKTSFCEGRFIEDTIIPMINKMKSDWIDNNTINDVIMEVYKWKIIPLWLINKLCPQ